MNPIRTAVVGFGLSGRVFHTPFIDLSPKFSLTHIVQQSQKTAQAVYPEVTLCSFEAVLANEAIELVVIATPNELHYQMTDAALEAGKHVIVEKPFAATHEQGKRLVEKAAELNKAFLVFHNRRLDGDFLTVKKLVDSKVLGEIVDYEAHYDRFSPGIHQKQWKEKADPSISILYDLGTHIIDQTVALFGRPHAVTAHLAIQRLHSKIVDSFSIVLDYRSFNATLKSGMLVREPGPRYVIHGRAGSFVKYGIDPQEDDLKAGMLPNDDEWGRESPEHWGVLHTELNSQVFRGTIETEPGNYMVFYDHVYGVIRKGKAPLLQPEEALITLEIIDLAIKSHQQRRTIELGAVGER